MASNPKQRQARNSFLLGMVVSILIAGVIIVLLFMQMKKLKEANQEYVKNTKTVCVLTESIKSGEIITSDKCKKVNITTDSLPDDYVDINSLINAYSLYTKEGVRIIFKYINDEQHLYLDDGKNTEVFKNDQDQYYIKNGNNEEYIEIAEAPIIAKIDLAANTVVTQSMIARSDEVAKNDIRQTEYNSIVLPIDLMTGEYIDIRLMLPSGQNCVVLSKKRVTIPEVDGQYLADTIQMNLTEDEILVMSSAIVENWMMQGSSMLYATKYVEAGIQEEAITTYVPNKETYDLMQMDPNIAARASAELNQRYNSLSNLRNNDINGAVSSYGSKDAIPGKMDSTISSTLEARQEYLQSLGGE